MLLKHVNTAKIQYLANLCLKVNAKLGGRNAVPRDKLPFVQDVSELPRPRIVVFSRCTWNYLVLEILFGIDGPVDFGACVIVSI